MARQINQDIDFVIDGKPLNFADTVTYRGMMFTGVPNMVWVMGYFRASWTLRVDMMGDFVCKLLNHMDARGYTTCVPRRRDPSVKEQPLLDFSSGYVQRAIDRFPRQGSIAPWKLHQNYAFDMMLLRHSPIEDGTMEFSKA